MTPSFMRFSPFMFLASLFVVSPPVLAGPLSVPTTDSFVWDNGDTKWFELAWNGTVATFEVEDLGTATYSSPTVCCTDTFDRVHDLYPGATLTFTDLSINTMPVNTVFEDNLNLELFSQGALDNLFLLTGNVTLNWDDPLVRMPVLNFTITPESDPSPVPEPGSLFLVGSTLCGGSAWVRRRRRGILPQA